MTLNRSDAEKFRAQFGPWALVAGASDGIGESFARQLASAGINLVLLARRAVLLDEVAAQLRADFRIETRVLVANLTSSDLDGCVAEGTEGLEIGMLVYNAGAIHGAKTFHDHTVEQALSLVDLNCRGPVLLAHRLGLPMRDRGRGGIVLLTSMAGLAGSSYTATYAATKSFDLVLAESLWHELGPSGVDVMAVIAGATKTPSMLNSNESFADYPNVMDSEEVAIGALANLGRGPVWVAGAHNRAAAAGMLPVPRTALINGMSEATAQLYDLPFVPVEGKEFAELVDGDR